MTMQAQSAPPFDRGQTLNPFLYGNEVTFVTDGTTNPVTVEHPDETQVGREHWFADCDYRTKGRPARSAGMVLCRAARNLSGSNVLPKRLVYTGTTLASGSYTSLGGSKERARVYGYVDKLNAIGYPVDEFLPAAGVVNYDIFWLVIRGPATILTDMGSLLGAIAINDPLVGQTAAASTGFTGTTGIGGRLTGMTYGSTGVGAVVGTALLGMIGRALSAMSSQGTGQDLLVAVNVFGDP